MNNLHHFYFSKKTILYARLGKCTMPFKNLKMNILKRYIPFIALAATVYVFYAFVYGGALKYAEQYQLCQTTWDYFASLTQRPGGIAMYIGRFCTQFFFRPATGALFIALLTTGIFACIVSLSESNKYKYQAGAAAALLSACTLLNQFALANSLVCICIGCFILLIINKIKHTKAIAFVLPTVIAATYWIAGGVPASMIVIYLICNNIATKTHNKRLWTGIAVATLLIIVAPAIARQVFGVQLNTVRAFVGADYFRYVGYVSKLPVLICVFIGLLPLTMLWQPKTQKSKRQKKSISVRYITSWILVICTFVFIFQRKVSFDFNYKCEIEFYARTQKWDKIVAIAEKHHPTEYSALIYTNLGLAKTNQLGDRMFEFPQHGVFGLVPDFKLNMDYSMALSEVYYQLGFMNFAERFAFEAPKSNPDYQESARAVKRLADINIIKENYPLAKKYLLLLENTVYYSKWAKKSLKYIEEGRTNENAEWAMLRNLQVNDEFFYTEAERDMMLGKIFLANESNKLAFDYMMAYYLLDKKPEKFMNYVSLGQHFYVDRMPRAFTEAALYFMQSKSESMLKNLKADENVIYKRLLDFGDIYNVSKDDPRLKERFGDTYWYYLITN